MRFVAPIGPMSVVFYPFYKLQAASHRVQAASDMLGPTRFASVSCGSSLSTAGQSGGHITSFPVAARRMCNPSERAGIKVCVPGCSILRATSSATFANWKRRRTRTPETCLPDICDRQASSRCYARSSWSCLRDAGDRRFDSPSRLRSWTIWRYALAGFVWDRGRTMRSISP